MIQYYNPYVTQPVALVPNTQGPDLSGWTVPSTPGTLPFLETSYIENILRLNLGKSATVYMNFENSQWGSKVFKGVIEAAGKDHLILSDPVTQMRYLLLTIYLNYITFDEEIEYEYPIADILAGMQQQQPQQGIQPFQQPSQSQNQQQFQQAPQQFQQAPQQFQQAPQGQYQYQQPQPFQQRKDNKKEKNKSTK